MKAKKIYAKLKNSLYEHLVLIICHIKISSGKKADLIQTLNLEISRSLTLILIVVLQELNSKMTVSSAKE